MSGGGEYGFRDLERDLAGAGLRVVAAVSRELVATGHEIRDLAQELAVIGPTHQWSESMRVFADGTERAPSVGDTAIEVTNLDWGAHFAEFGTPHSAPIAAIGPAFDAKVPGFIERAADIAAERFLP